MENNKEEKMKHINKRKTLAMIMLMSMAATSFTGCTGDKKDTSQAEEPKGVTQMLDQTDKLKTAQIDDKYGTTYEVFVRSFYDSNGDGIGDLKGVEKKLDYIAKKGLGVDGIWLMPVNKSTTYHKYDVVDYEDIDPEYGTMEDMDSLLKASHEKGLKVYMDLVMNHTSDKHQWFQTAKKYLEEHPDIDFTNASYVNVISSTSDSKVSNSYVSAIKECPYVGYYNFSNEKEDGYESLSGTKYYYEARFWSGMPDLNLSNESVKSEFDKITTFWMNKGVDGFRLDAAKEYKTGSSSYNIEFLKWFNNMVKSKDPKAYIVAEVWSDVSDYSQYYQSGIDSCFDFAFADGTGLIAGLARGTKDMDHYGDSLQNIEKLLKKNNPNAVDAPFYTNHDMNRSAGFYSGSKAEDRTKFAEALNLMMQGNAFLYYGDETGLKGSGKDENKRLPMRWGKSGSKGMTEAPTGAEKIEQAYGALPAQEKDPASIYNYVKACIKVRNAFPVIARGDSVMDTDRSGKEVCVIRKEIPKNIPEGMSGDISKYEPVTIVFNNSEKSQTVKIDGKIAASLLTGNEKASMKQGQLTIPAFGVVVMTDSSK
jgi:alpha-amylase